MFLKGKIGCFCSTNVVYVAKMGMGSKQGQIPWHNQMAGGKLLFRLGSLQIS
jgi:hypothetical protein